MCVMVTARWWWYMVVYVKVVWWKAAIPVSKERRVSHLMCSQAVYTCIQTCPKYYYSVALQLCLCVRSLCCCYNLKMIVLKVLLSGYRIDVTRNHFLSPL